MIATGFGGAAARAGASAAQTPVDMTQYTEPSRLRPEAVGAPAPSTGIGRLTLTRRPLLDLPSIAGPAFAAPTPAPVPMIPPPAAPSSTTTSSTSSTSSSAAILSGAPVLSSAASAPLTKASAGVNTGGDPLDELRLQIDSEFESAATFDVPAFLRRQEG